MALATTSTQLGCGRDVDEVWNHLDRAPDAHERTCPYCQAARADLAGLAEATRAMRDDEDQNPDRQPGPHVLDRILSVARAEVRRGRRLPLDQPTDADTSPNTVSEQTVTAVVRRAGDLNRQVQVRRCTVTTYLGDTATSGRVRPPRAVPAATPDESAPGPAPVRVSLRVSVAWNLPIAVACDRLRASVIDAVAREVGLNVVSVDIAVEDVHDA